MIVFSFLLEREEAPHPPPTKEDLLFFFVKREAFSSEVWFYISQIPRVLFLAKAYSSPPPAHEGDQKKLPRDTGKIFFLRTRPFPLEKP